MRYFFPKNDIIVCCPVLPLLGFLVGATSFDPFLASGLGFGTGASLSSSTLLTFDVLDLAFAAAGGSSSSSTDSYDE